MLANLLEVGSSISSSNLWSICFSETFQTTKQGNLGTGPNVVLNMAKYTIISLILTDFVPIFFIFNMFQRIVRGSFCFKKSQVDFRGVGVGNPFQKSPNPASGGGGGSSPL